MAGDVRTEVMSQKLRNDFFAPVEGYDDLDKFLSSLSGEKRSQFLKDYAEVIAKRIPFDELAMNKYPDMPEELSRLDRIKLLKMVQDEVPSVTSSDFTTQFDNYSAPKKTPIEPRKDAIKKKIVGNPDAGVTVTKTETTVTPEIETELKTIAKDGNKVKALEYLKGLPKQLLKGAMDVLAPLGIALTIEEVNKANEEGVQRGDTGVVGNYIKYAPGGSRDVEAKAEGEAQDVRNKKALADLRVKGTPNLEKEVMSTQIGGKDTAPTTRLSMDDESFRRAYADSKRGSMEKKLDGIRLPTRAQEKTNEDFGHTYWSAINKALDIGKESGVIKINGQSIRLHPEDLDLAKKFRAEAIRAKMENMGVANEE